METKEKRQCSRAHTQPILSVYGVDQKNCSFHLNAVAFKWKRKNGVVSCERIHDSKIFFFSYIYFVNFILIIPIFSLSFVWCARLLIRSKQCFIPALCIRIDILFLCLIVSGIVTLIIWYELFYTLVSNNIITHCDLCTI